MKEQRKLAVLFLGMKECDQPEMGASVSECLRPDDVTSMRQIFGDCFVNKTDLLIADDSLQSKQIDLSSIASVFDCDPLVGSVSALSNRGLYACSTAKLEWGRTLMSPGRQENARVILPIASFAGCIVRYELLELMREMLCEGTVPWIALCEALTQVSRLGYCTVFDFRQVIAFTSEQNSSHSFDSMIEAFQRSGKLESASDLNKWREWPTLQAFCHARDQILAFADQRKSRRFKVLLDARDLGASFNGTGEVILSVLKELDRTSLELEFTVLVGEAGRRFHDLDARFKTLKFLSELSSESYSLFFKFSQAWANAEVSAAHQIAPLVGFLMHDSIMWDCFYLRSHALEGVWRELNSTTDLVVFNSEYTMSRYHFRFGSDGGALQVPLRLSLAARDYDRRESISGKDGVRRILVVGNSYAHKFMEPTVRFLLKEFNDPDLEFHLLGTDRVSEPRVRGYLSGQLESAFVNQLYSKADVVIYPSVYEGFGFPFVRAVSMGCNVVARRNELNREILSAMRIDNSRVHLFEGWNELKTAVREALSDGVGKDGNSSDWDWKQFSVALEGSFLSTVQQFSVDRVLSRHDLNLVHVSTERR